MSVSDTNNIAPNQVALCTYTVDLGPYRYDWFYGLADEDLTDAWVRPRLVNWELQAYLNRFFTGWRLLRLVTMHRHHPGANPYKTLLYVIQVDTDADAETLRSHLRGIDYEPPFRADTGRG